MAAFGSSFQYGYNVAVIDAPSTVGPAHLHLATKKWGGVCACEGRKKGAAVPTCSQAGVHIVVLPRKRQEHTLVYTAVTQGVSLRQVPNLGENMAQRRHLACRGFRGESPGSDLPHCTAADLCA